MSTLWGASSSRSRAWILVPVVLGVFLLVAVALSNFQQELGLAEPGPGGRVAVAAAADVDRVLSEGDSYDEYGTALRVALVARHNMVVGNPADIELNHLLGRILACYSAARVAWQAESEGVWDPATLGDPEYWRATHPGLQLPDTTLLEPSAVRLACRLQAAELLTQAVDIVDD